MVDEQAAGGPGAVDPADAPGAAPPGFGQSRYQLDGDDTPTVPTLFTQQSVPAGFWEAPQELGSTVAVDLPERRGRRRGAFLAVGLVALATVVVVAAALLIGPHLGGSRTDDDQQAAPPVTPHSTSTATPSRASTTATSKAATAPATTQPTAPEPGAPTSDAAAPGPTVRTVTVTAGASGGSAGETTRAATTATASATAAHAASSTGTHAGTSSTTGPASKYGVPVRQIACGSGYIVQLASELTAGSFAHRVADLKGKGMVPADAMAADSTKSCKLFTNQTNTLILYAGPFAHPYDACADRMAGPYDAFIRGANPTTSADFVSCICPARAGDLPRIGRSSAPDQWIGELQRMLAAHLRYSIPDLGVGAWGRYTTDTRGAVKRFQSDHHLRATGTVDGRTWSALQRAGC